MNKPGRKRQAEELTAKVREKEKEKEEKEKVPEKEEEEKAGRRSCRERMRILNKGQSSAKDKVR